MPRVFYGPFSSQYATHAEPAGGNCGLFPLGTKLVLPDEREFRYSLNDGTVEVAGNLYEATVPDTAHGGSTTAIACDVARAIGATAISATLGASAAAVDLYSEGVIHINVGSGLGYGYRIRRAIAAGQAHAAVLSSGIITVNLEPGESVQVALAATTTEVTLNRNRHHAILIHPASDPTGQLAGISPGVCAADRYYYAQFKGVAAVLFAASVLNDDVAVASTGTAGAVMPSAAIETDGPAVGVCARIASAAEYGLLNLDIV